MAGKRLSREEANQLYDNLQTRMDAMIKKQNVSVGAVKSAPKSSTKSSTPPSSGAGAMTKESARPQTQTSIARPMISQSYRGQVIAAAVVALFCCAKVTVSALEAAGLGDVPRAEASVVSVSPSPSTQRWSKEEVKILTALDRRRSELEERSGRLEQREHEFAARDRDLAARLTELKEISERLKLDREKSDKQRDVQLDQLANVYGSMNPPEAAHLLEQLDVGIALSLIQRMPEKRIGQILSLMSASRALEITNRLSMRSSK
jgi:flagellar motility protein MotE (MotC chaperone)